MDPDCATLCWLNGDNLPFTGQNDSVFLDLDAAKLVITLSLVRNA